MCGIAGWANLDPNTPKKFGDEALLTAMCDRMSHRGPDSMGNWHGRGVAFQMRRLAIIDLVTGEQPVRSQDGSITAIMNGEIYNYREIRSALQAKGYKFASGSDTEVLPHLYEEYGDAMVDHLNGMFAFALWDEGRQRLLLSRDRLGEKPLYYGVFNNTLLFASELKTLIAHPDVEVKLNIQALRQYLSYDYVPSPLSIFEDIYKLPAAHNLVLENGAFKVEQYWKLSFHDRDPMPSLERAAEELRELVADATRMRLVSDVPLGVLLSGGVDSSAVAAFAQQYSSKPIKTFCIGFEEASFDESGYAREVADHLGTEHHEDVLSVTRAADLVPEIASWLDEPLSDPSILPTFLLSRFARSQVTVALGGDGGDEIFAGYPTYYAHKMAERYEKIPGPLRRNVIERVIHSLPTNKKSMSFEFVAKRFVRSLEYPDLVERHHALLGSFMRAEQDVLLTDSVRSQNGADIYGGARRWLEMCDADNVIEQAQFLDMKLFLGDGILTKVDRASMAVSLEVRAPFLDPRVVEFAAELSEYYKLHCQTIRFGFGKTGKYVLKKAVKDLLPPTVTKRMKKGFVMPVSGWLKGKMNPMLHDLLAEDRLVRQGLFNPAYVQKLIADHERGKFDNGKTLWTMLIFQLWTDNFSVKKPIAI